MNTRIKAVLVDDEARSREVLRRLLQKYFPQVDICEAASVSDAYALIRETQPQLVFLDIQMPREDGFALLKRFDVVPFHVIFVTSYDQYAIEAIRMNALHYLLKPVEISELKNAMGRVIQRIGEQADNNMQVLNLLDSLHPDTADKKIAVHSGEKVKLLELLDIAYMEADRRYSHLFTAAGEKFTVARPLAELEAYLNGNPVFVRISKSVILNVRSIKEYSKTEPYLITLAGGKAFEIPRRRRPDILEKLRQITSI